MRDKLKWIETEKNRDLDWNLILNTPPQDKSSIPVSAASWIGCDAMPVMPTVTQGFCCAWDTCSYVGFWLCLQCCMGLHGITPGHTWVALGCAWIVSGCTWTHMAVPGCASPQQFVHGCTGSSSVFSHDRLWFSLKSWWTPSQFKVLPDSGSVYQSWGTLIQFIVMTDSSSVVLMDSSSVYSLDGF